MRRLLIIVLALAALALPAVASAHPLGNFTTNHFTRIEVAGDRVYVTYVLDLAEIPTFQERGTVKRLGDAAYGRTLAADIQRQLTLTVDGRPVGAPATRPGDRLPARRRRPADDAAGGAVRDRLARARAGAARLPRRDASPAGSAGARSSSRRATARRLTSSSAPDTSASDELRAYPKDLLSDPLDVRTATLAVDPGTSPGAPPALEHRRGRRGRARGGRERDRLRGADLAARPRRGRDRAVAPDRALLGRRPCAHARATARRSWPPTWSARAARRGTRCCSGSP